MPDYVITVRYDNEHRIYMARCEVDPGLKIYDT